MTAVHKANVLKLTEGLFLREVRAVAGEFSDVAYDEQLVDSMAALLVRDAARFDVVVTTNMYGDILSDEAAELAGSLGLAGSINADGHRSGARRFDRKGRNPDARPRRTARHAGVHRRAMRAAALNSPADRAPA